MVVLHGLTRSSHGIRCGVAFAEGLPKRLTLLKMGIAEIEQLKALLIGELKSFGHFRGEDAASLHTALHAALLGVGR